jgi:hypothetical protein
MKKNFSGNTELAAGTEQAIKVREWGRETIEGMGGP